MIKGHFFRKDAWGRRLGKRWAVWALAAASALAPSLARAQTAEYVRFPSLDNWKGNAPLQLDGYFFRPPGKDRYAAIVMFHGCAGAISEDSGRITSRFIEMSRLLTGMGYAVLLVDSFNPRGTHQICTTRPSQREIHDRHRVLDAYGALAYLESRPDVIAGRVGAIGFSHGGTNAVAVMDATSQAYRQSGRRFAASVSLYPGCTSLLRKQPEYQAYGPLLVLAGELDDWTRADRCQALIERSRGRGEPVDIVVYPGAHHGFDQKTEVRLRTDVTHGRNGTAGVHVGGNPQARRDAYRRIREFFGTHLTP